MKKGEDSDPMNVTSILEEELRVYDTSSGVVAQICHG